MTESELIQSFREEYRLSGLSYRTIELFRTIVYSHYHMHGRRFPWRETIHPYHIVVSELMLQQTQTDRVVSKYSEFIKMFPGFEELDNASVQEILKVWQGLGYNRRALYLKQIAHKVIHHFHGVLPESPETLITFPGIGHATAHSIAAFAFSAPVAFIETNIRTVYIYFFADSAQQVRDQELLPYIRQTLDPSDPRSWYYALMDYGVKLKKEQGNLSRKSAHYHKQSAFRGSRREVRGKILKLLLSEPDMTLNQIAEKLTLELSLIESVVSQLEKEAFLKRDGEKLSLF